MLNTDSIYIGTKLKYIVEIGCAGFSMKNDRFTVDLVRGPNTIHFEKYDMELDENDCYFVCFDTLELGTGKVTAIVKAYVPDDDYEDGVRVEVQKIDLLYISA